MLITTLILLLGTIAIWSQHRRVYTVSEALAERTELNGQLITVRGFSLFVYEQTLQLCQPSRCDCNQSGSNYFLLVDEDTLAKSQQNPINTEQGIEAHMLDCQGDECTMTCHPINPKAQNELELTGIFHYDPATSSSAKLDPVQPDTAREKIGGVWQLITTGDFTIQLQQP